MDFNGYCQVYRLQSIGKLIIYLFIILYYLLYKISESKIPKAYIITFIDIP